MRCASHYPITPHGIPLGMDTYMPLHKFIATLDKYMEGHKVITLNFDPTKPIGVMIGYYVDEKQGLIEIQMEMAEMEISLSGITRRVGMLDDGDTIIEDFDLTQLSIAQTPKKESFE